MIRSKTWTRESEVKDIQAHFDVSHSEPFQGLAFFDIDDIDVSERYHQTEDDSETAAFFQNKKTLAIEDTGLQAEFDDLTSKELF